MNSYKNPCAELLEKHSGIDYKNRILNIMELYYHSKESALEWYDRPHGLLSDWKRKVSPREMVETGNGQEVLNFIKKLID